MASCRAYFKDEKQRTLALAISRNDPNLERIAKAGVPLNTQGYDGITFLHFIFLASTLHTDQNRIRIGKILLDAGANPDLPDAMGKTSQKRARI